MKKSLVPNTSEVSSKNDATLLDLPSEVFAHILSFVDGDTLLKTCPLVCSKFYQYLKSFSFWQTRIEQMFSADELKWLNSHSVSIDYGRLAICQPFKRNLIRNCSGQLKSAEFWLLSGNDETQLSVEITRCRKKSVPGIGIQMTSDEFEAMATEIPKWLEIPIRNCCFSPATKFESMHQIVNLSTVGCQSEIIDEVRPLIGIGQWVAFYQDPGVKYRLQVVLCNENLSILAKFSSDIEYQPEHDGQWYAIHHVFTSYPIGVRRIALCLSTVDKQGCANDNYGVKFAGSTVKLLLLPQTN